MKVPSALSTKVVTVSSIATTVPSPEVCVAIVLTLALALSSVTTETREVMAIVLVVPSSSTYSKELVAALKEREVTVSQLSTTLHRLILVVTPSSST